MELTRELILPYQGLHGFDGLCHLRVYDQPGQLPVAIAGALEDNPGTSITNAITTLAAAIQRSQFADGREFRLIEHYPDTVDQRGTPTYALVHFNHRAIHESPLDAAHYAGTVVVLGEDATVSRGTPIAGDFRDPRWEPIADIQELLGCPVDVWTPGSYTAGAVAGDEGEELRSLLAENANRAGERMIAMLE